MKKVHASLSPLFVAFTVIFVVCLIISNLIANKKIELAGFIFTAGILVFPITYILGDIFTEVYGIKKARFVIFLGFIANLILSLILTIAVEIKPSPVYADQNAFATIFGQVPRVVIASLIAYLVGEFANAFVLVKIKKITNGKFLWMRTIGSTIIGQILDSTLFMVIAFVSFDDPAANGWLPLAIASQAVFKISYETLFTPLTYLTVRLVKKYEGNK